MVTYHTQLFVSLRPLERDRCGGEEGDLKNDPNKACYFKELAHTPCVGCDVTRSTMRGRSPAREGPGLGGYHFEVSHSSK